MDGDASSSNRWRNRITRYAPLRVEEALYNPMNWRIHPLEQQRALAGVMRDVGIVQNVIVNERTGNLVDGHLRVLLADQEGIVEIPATYVDLTPEEEMEILATLDSIGASAATDEEKLGEVLKGISTEDGEVVKFLSSIAPGDVNMKGEVDLLSQRSEELKRDGLGKVYELSDGAEFDRVGEWELPSLREDMMLDMPAPNIWAGPLASEGVKPPYFYNYGTDSTVGLPWEQTVVGFYTDDYRFEQFWNATRDIATRLLNRNVLGIVAPNFSTYNTMPRPVRLYNVFRSRWIARYCQEAGIRIVPDIQIGVEELPQGLAGIPKGSPVCIQMHRKLEPEMVEIKRATMRAVMKHVDPGRVWVYATPDRLEWIPELKEVESIVEFIKPRTVAQRERGDKQRRKYGS